MMSSEARVATPLATRYMTQLCKHFEHKVPATYNGMAGTITFPFGTCQLEAMPNTLVMRAEAADPATLAQLEDVIARHLVRFAFREPPEVTWAPAA